MMKSCFCLRRIFGFILLLISAGATATPYYVLVTERSGRVPDSSIHAMHRPKRLYRCENEEGTIMASFGPMYVCYGVHRDIICTVENKRDEQGMSEVSVFSTVSGERIYNWTINAICIQTFAPFQETVALSADCRFAFFPQFQSDTLVRVTLATGRVDRFAVDEKIHFPAWQHTGRGLVMYNRDLSKIALVSDAGEITPIPIEAPKLPAYIEGSDERGFQSPLVLLADGTAVYSDWRAHIAIGELSETLRFDTFLRNDFVDRHTVAYPHYTEIDEEYPRLVFGIEHRGAIQLARFYGVKQRGFTGSMEIPGEAVAFRFEPDGKYYLVLDREKNALIRYKPHSHAGETVFQFPDAYPVTRVTRLLPTIPFTP